MEANKEIAKRLYEEVINKGNLDALESILAPEYRDHLAPEQPPGIQGFKDFLRMVSSAFPDVQVRIEDMLAESDKVAVRVSVTGTHSGVLMGIQPTGKKATWTGIDILRIVEGKIVGRWSERNLLSMMKQLGVIE